MSVRHSIQGMLTADAGVAALVATRIYHRRAPQATAEPYILHRRLNLQADQHHGGRGSGDRYLYEVQAIGRTQAEAESVADAVRGALDGKSGTGIHICMHDDEFDPEDFAEDGSDQPRGRLVAQYIVRTTPGA